MRSACEQAKQKLADTQITVASGMDGLLAVTTIPESENSCDCYCGYAWDSSDHCRDKKQVKILHLRIKRPWLRQVILLFKWQKNVCFDFYR